MLYRGGGPPLPDEFEAAANESRGGPLFGNVTGTRGGPIFGEVYTHAIHGGLNASYVHAFGTSAAGRPPAPASRLHAHGFRDGSLVEVRHRCCDACSLGFWMALSPGSGIWYNLGRTKAFADRGGACRFFSLRLNCSRVASTHKLYPPAEVELPALLAITSAARRLRYDSLQFISGPGHNYEVVDLRDGDGSPACEDAYAARPPRPPPAERERLKYSAVLHHFVLSLAELGGAENVLRNQSCHPSRPDLFTAGWRGAMRPCDCDEALGVLNCRGTASHDVARAARNVTWGTLGLVNYTARKAQARWEYVSVAVGERE